MVIKLSSRYKYSQYSTHFPEASTGNHYRFTFATPYGNICQDLKRMVLLATVSLQKKNGDPVDNAAFVAPECNLLYNLFSSLRVYINNTEVRGQLPFHNSYSNYFHFQGRATDELPPLLLYYDKIIRYKTR